MFADLSGAPSIKLFAGFLVQVGTPSRAPPGLAANWAFTPVLAMGNSTALALNSLGDVATGFVKWEFSPKVVLKHWRGGALTEHTKPHQPHHARTPQSNPPKTTTQNKTHKPTGSGFPRLLLLPRHGRFLRSRPRDRSAGDLPCSQPQHHPPAERHGVLPGHRPPAPGATLSLSVHLHHHKFHHHHYPHQPQPLVSVVDEAGDAVAGVVCQARLVHDGSEQEAKNGVLVNAASLPADAQGRCVFEALGLAFATANTVYRVQFFVGLVTTLSHPLPMGTSSSRLELVDGLRCWALFFVRGLLVSAFLWNE